MFKIMRAILTIFVGIQIIRVESEETFSKQMNFRFCPNEHKNGLQMTNENGGNVYQCVSEPLKNSCTREDYVYTPGVGFHKLHVIAKTWNEARKICNQENGHLAIINSKLEESILVNMLKKAEKSIEGALNTDEAFLGIHDLYQEGEWVTIFGEPLNSTGYSSWSPNYWSVAQPDNAGGNQNCGTVLTTTGMDDVFCVNRFAFFCELPLSCYKLDNSEMMA